MSDKYVETLSEERRKKKKLEEKFRRGDNTERD